MNCSNRFASRFMPRASLVRGAGCLALLAMLAACSPNDKVGITDRAQIVQAVAGQLNLWVRAINNRSLDTLGALYLRSPDVAIVWLDGERTRGWNEAASKWKRYLDGLSQLNFVMENPVIDVVDRNVAVVTFRTVVDAVGAGRERHPGRGTQVWMKDPSDGRWRIRDEHQSIVLEKS